MASLSDPQPRPFTADEYDRMIEAGILGEDERVELLEGDRAIRIDSLFS